jgi:hypothetical protein
MNLKKPDPSSFDIYASAWEALKKDIAPQFYLEKEGWKTCREIFPEKTYDSASKLCARLVEKKKLERFLVVGTGRKTNFYRPVL